MRPNVRHWSGTPAIHNTQKVPRPHSSGEKGHCQVKLAAEDWCLRVVPSGGTRAGTFQGYALKTQRITTPRDPDSDGHNCTGITLWPTGGTRAEPSTDATRYCVQNGMLRTCTSLARHNCPAGLRCLCGDRADSPLPRSLVIIGRDPDRIAHEVTRMGYNCHAGRHNPMAVLTIRRLNCPMIVGRDPDRSECRRQ